jgi:hypothetical protein
MFGDAPLVRPPVREHDPLGHDRRLPAAVACDDTRQAPTTIGNHQEATRVNELGLDLDEEERATAGIPGDEVDNAALPEMAE